jgi:hypothetical protein
MASPAALSRIRCRDPRPPPSSTRSTSLSTTSSSVIWVESNTTAPRATASGESARVVSCRSLRDCSSSTRSTSVSSPRARSSAHRRSARAAGCGQKDFEVGIRKHHRAHVPPLHDATVGGTESALFRNQGATHIRQCRDRRRHRRALGRADRLRHVLTVDQDCHGPGAGNHIDGAVRQFRDGRPVVGIQGRPEPGPKRHESHGAVHGPGVQIHDIQATGERPGHRGLPGP